MRNKDITWCGLIALHHVSFSFQILEVSYFNEKVERFDDTETVLSAVKELQHYGVVRQQLNTGYIKL